MDELNLGDESPTEKAEVRLEVSRIKVAWLVIGRDSWLPLFFGLVLLLAVVAAFISVRLLPPGATLVMGALVAAITGGAVVLGGAALVYLWHLITKRERHRKEIS